MSKKDSANLSIWNLKTNITILVIVNIFVKCYLNQNEQNVAKRKNHMKKIDICTLSKKTSEKINA